MRVGILTFHRAINYGAVLQCYALKETLSSLGHDVYVIDYRQPYVEENDRHRFTTKRAHQVPSRLSSSFISELQ